LSEPLDRSGGSEVRADETRDRLASIAPQGPVQVHTARVLRSARMMIRPLVESDRAEYLRSARVSAEALTVFMPLHRGEETDDQMFDRQIRAMAVEGAAGRCYRCVGLLTDGRIAGGFNLNAISRGLEVRADITWWIASDLTGKGLASEGVDAMLRFALDDFPDGLGLHTVSAWITEDNAASMRVAEKVGLRKQGEERSYLDTGNRWALHHMFVRNAGDPVPG